jgi:hypothetical protein
LGSPRFGILGSTEAVNVLVNPLLRNAEIAFITQVFDGCERPGFSVHNMAGGTGHVETNSAAV